MKSPPRPNAALEDLFNAVKWVAAGFEIVQSHLPDWKFTITETVADSGLHSRLLVGPKIPVSDICVNSLELDTLLAKTRVALMRGDEIVDQGTGANVLDSPLRALHYFLTELRQCPGAPDLIAGDVITTGTLTDAWPINAGECWAADFSTPFARLGVGFQ